MPASRQIILPSGVVVVVAPDADAAMDVAARLCAAGIDQGSLVATRDTMDPEKVTGDLSAAVRRHGHAVAVTVDPAVDTVALAVSAARRLGKAATMVLTGNGEFVSHWQTLVAVTGADSAHQFDPHVELMPYRGAVDMRTYRGRFAVIGDVHGCQQTLTERMLPALGWNQDDPRAPLLVSVGDVHDKGVDSVAAIRWWLAAMRSGAAVMTDSNHARALVRALVRPDMPVRDCVAETVEQIDAADDAAQLRTDIIATFGSLPTHLVLPGVVAVHAAMTEQRLWRQDLENRRFAIHTRFHLTPWHWTGSATLVHGHDTVPEVTTRRASGSMLRPGHVPGPVVNIDTGAYAGGGLSAYLSWTSGTLTVPSVPSEVTAALVDEMSPVSA